MQAVTGPENPVVVVSWKYTGGVPSAKPDGGGGREERTLTRVTPGVLIVENVTVTGLAPVTGSTGPSVRPPASKAPASHRMSATSSPGRRKPRSSVAGQSRTPVEWSASMAGLPVSRARVRVRPPLAVSGPSPASRGAPAVPAWSNGRPLTAGSLSSMAQLPLTMPTTLSRSDTKFLGAVPALRPKQSGETRSGGVGRPLSRPSRLPARIVSDIFTRPPSRLAMPPPTAAGSKFFDRSRLALLSEIVLKLLVRTPSFSRPPPPRAARFPLTVVLVRVRVPQFEIPPPDRAVAVLPLTVQRSRVSVAMRAL